MYKELNPAYNTPTHPHELPTKLRSLRRLEEDTIQQQCWAGAHPRGSHRTRTPSTELPASGSATSVRPPLCMGYLRSNPNKQHHGNSTMKLGRTQALPKVAKRRANDIRRNTESSKTMSSRKHDTRAPSPPDPQSLSFHRASSIQASESRTM
jgi:hypothetical protein